MKELLAKKTQVLSKARALDDLGMPETAQPLWHEAAMLEERLAPWMDSLGREAEGTLHRISAGSCYRKAGRPGHAANLLQAALAGQLSDQARHDVEEMLDQCLATYRETAATVSTDPT